VSYRFGQFVLDCDTRQLLAADREVHLSPKAFDLLAILLDHRPRAVAKAVLLERLWPSTFVEEANLASLVAEIRRALGDSATQPEFLRTVYRFGYRFVGDATTSGVTAASSSASPGPRPCLTLDNRETVLMEGVNVIGRAPDATILCEAAGVSRHHARIVVSQGKATLEDLGSKNGTFLRGERIAVARLSDGDEISLVKATLLFRVEPAPGATETVTQ
jgi:DNA-binding winged helix-turn-helix (wHTH) protein